MMTRPTDTPRTLRISPRAAALTIGSGDGPLRAEWRGPAPRIRERRGVTEVGYGVLGRLRALVTRRSSLALRLDPRIEGGASRTVVRRPSGEPVSVEIDGGASGLSVDDERLGAIGGHVLRHAGAGGPAVRLRVLGGAAQLGIEAATAP